MHAQGNAESNKMSYHKIRYMKPRMQPLKSSSPWRLLLILLLPLSTMKAREDLSVGPIAKDGCNDTCGNVRIPFPFGIGPGCFLDDWFEINCKTYPSNTFRPMLARFNDTEVLEIQLDSSESTIEDTDYSSYFAENNQIKVGIPSLNVCAADAKATRSSMDLRGSPYNFSASYNVFMMEGCPGSAYVVNHSNTVITGCATACPEENATSVVSSASCYGDECCQASLSLDYNPQFFQIDFNRRKSQAGCLVATLIEGESMDQFVGKLSGSDASPTVLLWNWKSSLSPDQNPRAVCSRSITNTSYCYCTGSYAGNPYVSNGCQLPDECKGCHGYCSRLDVIPYKCYPSPRIGPAALIGLTVGLGSVFLVIGCYGLYRFIKRRGEMRRRARFFKRNGGLLLQQQLLSKGVIERTKIFTVTELDKATDHFNANRILGQGGQGTVYKGMLVDGRIVAIKKSKLLDEGQLEQFINEVVILSQINHRNVVKLLGCCLETEIPLLVYEFVPNGTLSQNIHDPDEDFVISWEMRLKIALDSAGAITYLHSYSSFPIYHRDIKSSNILLDEKNRGKVSDFGSSKTIAIDQTHITTLVQGTLGYLDPEYFHSYQFTEKSDVYSFGVVLLEILTGKKPIYRGENMEQKNLVTEFFNMMKISDLSSILDPEVVKEAKQEELAAFIGLAKCCLNGSGKLRPTMKEVTMALEMIIKSPAHITLLNQEAPGTEEAETENVIKEASDIGSSKSSSARLSLDTNNSAFSDGLPLLFPTV